MREPGIHSKEQVHCVISKVCGTFRFWDKFKSSCGMIIIGILICLSNLHGISSKSST